MTDWTKKRRKSPSCPIVSVYFTEDLQQILTTHFSLAFSPGLISSLLLKYFLVCRSCFLYLPLRGFSCSLCLFASHPLLPSLSFVLLAFPSQVTWVSGLTEIFCNCLICSCGRIGVQCWPEWWTARAGNSFTWGGKQEVLTEEERKQVDSIDNCAALIFCLGW